MECGVAEAMCLRSPMDGVTFFRFSVLEQKCAVFCSRNAVAQKPCASGSLWNVVTISDSVFWNKIVPLFVHGIQWRKSHVPQEPCGAGGLFQIRCSGTKMCRILFKECGGAEAMCLRKLMERGDYFRFGVLEQNCAVVCSRNAVAQKPCASGNA